MKDTVGGQMCWQENASLHERKRDDLKIRTEASYVIWNWLKYEKNFLKYLVLKCSTKLITCNIWQEIDW